MNIETLPRVTELPGEGTYRFFLGMVTDGKNDLKTLMRFSGPGTSRADLCGKVIKEISPSGLGLFQLASGLIRYESIGKITYLVVEQRLPDSLMIEDLLREIFPFELILEGLKKDFPEYLLV